MYELYIANQNYSSWSLRPWVLMRELGIEFGEHMIPFGDGARWTAFHAICPSGKVPCLVHGNTVVWDSLAIVEYLAERHAAVWPSDSRARAWARSAAAEMHSGFAELRHRCSMSCGVRGRLTQTPPALDRDLERLQALFSDGLARFGGPFLAGSRFSAVDAFFAPVAFRAQTYDLTLDSAATAYLGQLLGLPSMKTWYTAALQERFRDLPHDREIAQMATVTQDLRAPI